MTEVVLFKRLSPQATIPTYGSDEAAGLDLYASEAAIAFAGQVTPIKTGLAFKPPEGTYGRIAPRSGLGKRNGVQIIGGVLDRDYRGEIIAMILPTTSLKVEVGDRIAQIILERCVRADPTEVDELDATDRSAGGFGSTGI